jgi:hypothetical protein
MDAGFVTLRIARSFVKRPRQCKLPSFASPDPLGGPSFSPALDLAFDCRLQPLKLQGLKPFSKNIHGRD